MYKGVFSDGTINFVSIFSNTWLVGSLVPTVGVNLFSIRFKNSGKWKSLDIRLGAFYF